jgi:NTP pyrophosphatase (non-canonical NTP hydrolase)
MDDKIESEQKQPVDPVKVALDAFISRFEVECSHVYMVKNKKKDPVNIQVSLTPTKVDLLHMALGLSGEVGELIDAIKKHTMYERPLDIVNVREELGDIEFYLAGIRQILSIDRVEILGENTSKLNTRYKEKFTNEEAQARNDKA